MPPQDTWKVCILKHPHRIPSHLSCLSAHHHPSWGLIQSITPCFPSPTISLSSFAYSFKSESKDHLLHILICPLQQVWWYSKIHEALKDFQPFEVPILLFISCVPSAISPLALRLVLLFSSLLCLSAHRLLPYSSIYFLSYLPSSLRSAWPSFYLSRDSLISSSPLLSSPLPSVSYPLPLTSLSGENWWAEDIQTQQIFHTLLQAFARASPCVLPQRG